ncbi:prenyltransferase/squalene oxidase repeat-containing protein [Acidithrix ferrooxidans]|uniref:Prenyltransferase and squalene oxidase repeat protein n=2 Tax=root TaxID=1 RepID=A0A0D8HIY3_9ACTN|nr:prenyltransferase/squalene oxidase repeat-containing protein [Acidithrix ferrooxidans]KJF17046.1 hypothetical protein AXFE_21170 [Acidithrix ferrooxidans]
MLTDLEIKTTAKWISEVQLRNGLIPWYSGGHIDPWNHIEAVIALGMAGFDESAIKGVDSLFSLQNRDGSFCHYYLTNGVKEPNRDPNVISYCALGLLALHSCIENLDVERYFPFVERALDYVVMYQRDDGSFPMMITPEGLCHPKSLLAGSCSILNSLEAGSFLAGIVDIEKPEWKRAHESLGDFIYSSDSRVVADKSSWAMDWYYPYLANIPRFGGQGLGLGPHREIGRFFVSGSGVRCISGRDWFTAAETAEASIAFSLSGMNEAATEIFWTTNRFRGEDGSYLTGLVYPSQASYPHEERSTYTAAAVIIANDVISSGIFGSLGEFFIERWLKRHHR